ncbi:MAG: serine/threonine-protein kinase [Aliiglaciecola sp.]|uniref:serine/threonine-protein kinase n=1 Tax=Aliiglaciecola sp. TaxID=1872441 RepID=UPI003297FE95
MDQQKWPLIKRLFSEAQSLPTPEQQAFVDLHSQGDSEVYENVMQMLGAENETKSDPNLTDIIAASASELLIDDQVLHTGDIVEHFKVVEPIGDGGMGSVFLAERIDEDFEQLVAIKVIHRKHITAQSLQRFRRERQILASLNHKNIASFIGGGETHQGQPYIILEYVNGSTITQYCQQHNLDIAQRLDLFKQVLEAVIYAHQNLIVHRDIKPNNVLVNAQGEVKLLDFGIAKLVQESSLNSPLSGDLTQEFTRVLTPANASPEQVLGSNITTRSDVYGLGALLMHLLTDEPVFDTSSTTQSSLESMIVDILPVRPSLKCLESSVEHIRQRAKLLKGDLDTIVMKALQKDPERRYSSTEHFLEDIVRHQRNYPISAKPDSLVYRVTKFVQRNTLSTMLVSLFLVSLISTSIVIMQQSITIQNERDAALKQAFIAQETAKFMTDMFDAADPNTHAGESISVKSLVDQAAVDLDKLNSDPLIMAQLSGTLSSVYNQLGEYDLSSSMMEKAEQYLFASKQDSENASYIALKFLLGNEKANLLVNTGQYDQALSLTASLIQDLENTDTSSLSAEQIDNFYIWLEYGLGSAYSYSGRDTLAIEHYQNALTRSEQVVAAGGVYAEEILIKHLSSRYFGLGHSLRRVGDYAQSKIVLLRGIEIEKSLDKAPSLDLAHGLNQLADTYLQLGELELAEKYAQEGLTIRRNIHDYGHIEIIASTGVLSNIYAKQKHYDRSIEMREEMLNMVEQAVGKEHPFYASVLEALGNLHVLSKDYLQARIYLDESYRRFAVSFPEGHKYVAKVLVSLGDLALHENQNQSAIDNFEQALQILASKAPEPSGLIAKANALYAVALYKNAQPEAAIEYEESALNILQTTFGLDSSEYKTLFQRLQDVKN